MTDVTQILFRIEQGDSEAAEQLLPVVYGELRQLAAANLASEKPGQTLQATALVHEAYLRLVDSPQSQQWDGRGHFFAAAATAMRRILVENARRKNRIKHGGNLKRQDLDLVPIVAPQIHEDLIALNESLDRLKSVDPQAVELVNLRYFAGLPVAEAAEILGISPRTADRVWAFARAWLHTDITGSENEFEKK
ncbi:MAG: sigma-70 family RNA polymerase sigma factor [Planctomycetaceae bacterium]|nr:sigma-70 family RNA polymerase sigma factor [Planctomycetaceae bacterium]